jgi:hypothetical protein
MDEPGGHLGRIAIGQAVLVVVQVVELADGGVAGAEHLDEQEPGDGAQLVRPHGMGDAIHRLPPCPETIGRIAALLGKAGHGALKGVGMEVRHARHDRAREALEPLAAGPGVVRRNRGDGALGRDVDPHVPRPAGGQHGGRCEQARHG